MVERSVSRAFSPVLIFVLGRAYHHQSWQPRYITGTRRGGVGRARAQQRTVPEGGARVQGFPGSVDSVTACRRGASRRSREFHSSTSTPVYLNCPFCRMICMISLAHVLV